MIITEDYFKDIEITDDIKEPDYLGDPEQDILYAQSFINELSSKYNNCITLTSFAFKNIYNDKNIQNVIHNVIKKLNYIFALYNVQHSEIFFIDMDSMQNQYKWKSEPIVVKDTEDRKIITRCTQDDLSVSSRMDYKDIALSVYVNFPNFTYRRAYYFVYDIYRCIYKYNQFTNDAENNANLFHKFIITDNAKSYKDSIHVENQYWYSSIPYLVLNVNDVPYCLNNNLPNILEFFYNILLFFFPEDQHKIQRMERELVEDGVNPFCLNKK